MSITIILSLYKPMKEENGSIVYSVLHFSCLTESPLRCTPPPPRALNKINLKQQQMEIRLTAASENKCVLQSPLWSLLQNKLCRYQTHLSYSIPDVGQQREASRDGMCCDTWRLLSQTSLSLFWQHCDTHSNCSVIWGHIISVAWAIIW